MKVIGHVVERPRAAPTCPPSNIARAQRSAARSYVGELRSASDGRAQGRLRPAVLQDLPRVRRREPVGNLTGDHVLDNITLYWLTGTGASAARSYWESYGAAAVATAAAQTPPEVSLPVGFTTFPGEIWRTPRSWVEQSYPNVIYFNEVDKGGHFAAWEEPEIFSSEVRAAFRPLR